MAVALQLRGVSPVIAVPFEADGRLDLAGFARVAEHIIAREVRSSLLFGLASEFPKLTDDERGTLLALYVQCARGSQLAIIASVTDHSADVAVTRARRYVDAGAGAINIFPPFFLSPSKLQILDHISAIAEAVDVPVVIQFAPNEAGTGINCASIAGLIGQHGTIAAVKVEATPPGAAIDELFATATRRPSVFVGYAGLHWPEAIAHGANGVQPGCSFVELYQAAQALLDAGDMAGFAASHSRLLPWIKGWMTGVEHIVAIEKAILAARGLIQSAYCRRPSFPLSAQDHAGIAAFITEFGDSLPNVRL